MTVLPGDLGDLDALRRGTVEHFGFIGRFFALDMSASSTRTREFLDWNPTGPTLIEDIKAGAYLSNQV